LQGYDCVVLKEVKSGAGWFHKGIGPFCRFFFVHGEVKLNKGLTAAAVNELLARQAQLPAAVMYVNASKRRYWMFQGRIYWDDEGLRQDDVLALIAEREVVRKFVEV
jgi:hypothetical protein